MTPWSKMMKERQEAGLCRYCGKPRDGPSKMYCMTHQEIQLAQLKARRAKRIVRGICSVGGCGRKLCKAGLCRRHYAYQTAKVLEHRIKYGRKGKTK